jgi:hypothetical protein
VSVSIADVVITAAAVPAQIRQAQELAISVFKNLLKIKTPY